MDRACAMSPAIVLWRTCNTNVDSMVKVETRYDGDVNYDYRMYELDNVAIDVMKKLRSKRRCHNLFVLDLHHITSLRRDLSYDGHHYPGLSPLFGQLAHNAYRLWLNESFPPEEPPSPSPSSSSSSSASLEAFS
jgi:hypothetical protein